MTDSNKWLVLAVLTGGGWLVYLLAPILTPFVAAALLAYLGDPTVDWLESHGIGRTLAVVIVFGLLFADHHAGFDHRHSNLGRADRQSGAAIA